MRKRKQHFIARRGNARRVHVRTRLDDNARALVAEDRVGRAGQQAYGAREVRVAEARGVDLDEDFVGLEGGEGDLGEVEFAVEFGDEEGGCC